MEIKKDVDEVLIYSNSNNIKSLVVIAETHDRITKKIYLFCKRIFDIVSSLCGIIVLSPIFTILGILVKLDSKGPIIYKHKRIGKNGDFIYLYKFRSMYENSEEMKTNFTPEQKAEYAKNFKLEKDPRITKIGKILRKTSLDELPQLFNILKGDMSVIGPRPVVAAELEKYTYNKNKFLSVTPGLTGYWASNGRSDTTYEERMIAELYYIDNMSMAFDIKIFFKTIISVLKKEGAI